MIRLLPSTGLLNAGELPLLRPREWIQKSWRRWSHFYKEKRARNELVRIDSFTVIRNGYIVADLYFNPLYPRDTPHILHSCTKSIISALVGIAIEEGYLKSVDVPVYKIFRDEDYKVLDERMKKVTVKHLLAMQSGIRSEDARPYGYRGLFRVQHTDDWVATFLKLPMDVEPGVRFDYSNLASFMLSAIIHETTGMDTLSFAKERLFGPLGIEDVQWEKSPQGIYIGWARMWLNPHDMAKFGLLYLQKGKWQDKQIIPAEWIAESVTPHSYPKNYRDILDENGEKDSKASLENWVATKFLKPFQDGYGYQIWLDRSGSFAAMGTSGQYIIVAPKENLVVVVTGKLIGLDTFLPPKMVEQFVLPAIDCDEAIAPNETAQNRLALLAGPPKEIVKAEAVPELPEIAMAISGVTYQLETNDWNYDNFQLVFDPEAKYTEFNYTAKLGEGVHMQIGLDNVPRLTETNNHTYAAVGYWSAPDTFTIEYEVVGYSTQDQWNLIFTDDRITVEEINEITGVKTYSGTSL